MTKELSKQLCELCGIKPIETPSRTYDCEGNVEMYINYPNFNGSNNKIILQNLLTENGCTITMNKDWCSISSSGYDIINDCYDEDTGFFGDTFLEAVYNYLTLWRVEQRSYRLEDGTMGPYIDMSHKLKRGECYYPKGYDELLKNIKKVKKAIKNTEWEF